MSRSLCCFKRSRRSDKKLFRQLGVSVLRNFSPPADRLPHGRYLRGFSWWPVTGRTGGLRASSSNIVRAPRETRVRSGLLIRKVTAKVFSAADIVAVVRIVSPRAPRIVHTFPPIERFRLINYCARQRDLRATYVRSCAKYVV